MVKASQDPASSLHQGTAVAWGRKVAAGVGAARRGASPRPIRTYRLDTHSYGLGYTICVPPALSPNCNGLH
eukprot:SAG31_NODE_9852_length_1220_cov_1.966994_2_plen_70_part_01